MTDYAPPLPLFSPPPDAIMRFRGDYHCFSNFGGGQAYHGGLLFPRSENAYQAAKFIDPSTRAIFADPQLTPAMAATIGRKLPIENPIWEVLQPNGRLGKMNVMAEILFDKFTRDVAARRILIATGLRLIVEGNHHGDELWGRVEIERGKWRGENWLGRVLMELRAKLT